MKNRNRPAPGKAIDAFKAGDFNAAIRICRRHMRKTRADPETLKLLVQALLQSAHPEEACKEAGRLMLLAPDDADASLLLGHALRFNGRLRDARGHFEQAVASHPEDARAWHELALARRDQGPMEAVIEAFDRACTLDPHNAIYRDNHLLALLEAGRAREAISRCREALENTGYPGDLQQILGQALMQSGDYPAARTAFEQALAAAPGNLEIMGNLATCLATLDEHERGIHLLRQCVTSSRSSLPVRKNLARALAEAGYADEALAELEGIARRADPVPNDLSAAKLARQLILDQRLDEADALLELALTASPADQALRSERARLLISLHTYDEAESLLDDLTRSGQENGAMHALLVLLYCATDRHRHALEVMQGKLHDKEHKRRLLEGLLYQLNYSDTCPRETLYHMHLEWASTLETNPPTRPPSYEPQDHDPERRLRIGYVSADFRDHSAAFFFEPLLSRRTLRQVENFCYSNNPLEDEVTRRLRTTADHWRQVEALDDAQLDALVRNDRIDILVDLSGHTTGNRLALFVRKPAPLQVTCIGDVNTTGLRQIDYRLTDAISDPPGLDDHLYTETLLRMPVCHFCYHGIEAAPRSATETTSEVLTFGSFNNMDKLSDSTLALWSRVLRGVPESRLLLKARKLADGNERSRLIQRFAALDVHAERIECVARLEDKEKHLRLYDRVDIALDTTPFNGITTTCEALWMGVPVIALHGDRYVARVASSLLRFAGLPELVAETPDAFVEKAVVLAADRKRLARYHAGLREQLSRSSLCDARGYAQQVEAIYREMWRRYIEDSTREVQG